MCMMNKTVVSSVLINWGERYGEYGDLADKRRWAHVSDVRTGVEKSIGGCESWPNTNVDDV